MNCGEFSFILSQSKPKVFPNILYRMRSLFIAGLSYPLYIYIVILLLLETRLGLLYLAVPGQRHLY